MVQCVSGVPPLKMKRSTSLCFPILALPEEIIVSILAHACEENLQDVRHMKITCKAMKRMAKSPIFYRSVNFVQMNVPWIPKIHTQTFFNHCYGYGNITALFSSGLATFSHSGHRLEGILELKAATDVGLGVAIYVYGMIRTYFAEDNDEYQLGAFRFSRNKESELARQSAMQLKMGHLRENLLWVTKAQSKRHIAQLTRCGCRHYNPWEGGIVPRVTKEKMCDTCFWEYHTNVVFAKISKKSLRWRLQWD